jgi:hypothetical protein
LAPAVPIGFRLLKVSQIYNAQRVLPDDSDSDDVGNNPGKGPAKGKGKGKGNGKAKAQANTHEVGIDWVGNY